MTMASWPPKPERHASWLLLAVVPILMVALALARTLFGPPW
jgi:hypothetical protein